MVGFPIMLRVTNPVASTLANQPGSRNAIRRVCSRMAGISEAINISLLPSPIAIPPALPTRAAMILSGSIVEINTTALAPSRRPIV